MRERLIMTSFGASAKFSAPALALAKAGGSGHGLPRAYHIHAPFEFIGQGLGQGQAPMLMGAEAVRAHARLGEIGQGGGQLLGGPFWPLRRARRGWPGPFAGASAASTGLPVRIMSMARLMPMSRGKRMVPPSMSGTPKRRQNTPNTAVSSITRMSHQQASSRPPATA